MCVFWCVRGFCCIGIVVGCGVGERRLIPSWFCVWCLFCLGYEACYFYVCFYVVAACLCDFYYAWFVVVMDAFLDDACCAVAESVYVDVVDWD